MQVLENEVLKVAISANGAELQSIYHKTVQLEYLWQGDPVVWPRKAPVLFPIVGKVKNNEYTVTDKKYSLTQHGFARDRMFDCIHFTNTSCTYRLSHSEASLLVFPFEFELDVIYTIEGESLTVSYRVFNPSTSKELYFSIGAHPGFNCPLVEGETFEDYYLEFEKSEKLSRVLLEGGLRSDASEEVLLTNKKLPLSADLFTVKDAIVVSGLYSECISLKSKKSSHGLHFNYKNYPWFGIWSKPGPFICLEPWMGVADDIHSDGNFIKKEGIQSLKPNTENLFSYSISLF
ncbi:aldose 1-epimerase family protein [uncultured Cytophaga sp.]|uniref:aldose 1-epimerase family protein n=1 Tax=uncultured Cytophaga sp. TaxID=160238 RepID=UPI002607D2BB|nr:aldose 1-epimerase family protein [uncultured Cytophaga sp.]